MSGNYDNNNTGALFKNDKEGNEKRADYRGQAEIDGRQYWVDSWLRTSKKGQKFLSLRFKPKQLQEHAGAPTNPPDRNRSADNIPFDDEIPF